MTKSLENSPSPASHLQQRLRAARQRIDGLPEATAQIPPRPDASLTASLAQEWLWLADQAANGHGHYNLHQSVRIRGPLDTEALNHSLHRIVARHRVLRTRYGVADGRPEPVLDATSKVAIAVHDAEGADSDARWQYALHRSQQCVEQAFDLSNEIPLRVLLVRLDDFDWLLTVVMHHIVTDGWSMSVFWDELAIGYATSERDGNGPLPELKSQYNDFSHWQRELLTGDVLADQLGFWRRRLEGLGSLALPADRRPSHVSGRGGRVIFTVPADLAAQLRIMSSQNGATLFSALLAGYFATLSRWTGQHDFAIGTPVTTRAKAEFEPLIGFFMNTIALRVDLRQDPSFSELLRQVRDETLEALEHQDLPFGMLVQDLQPPREAGRTPVFQVMFTLQQQETAAFTLPAARIEPVEIDTASSEFELSLTVTEGDEKLTAALTYSTDLFDAATVQGFATYYQRLLADAVAHPDRRVSDLRLWTESEQHALFGYQNDTTRPVPDHRTHELVESQARRSPHAIAVRQGAETLTYAELDQQSNRLATLLRQMGVGPESRVAVCLERTPQLLVALLAVLKAGGAYVPVDPRYPNDRIAYILAESGTRALLTTADLRSGLPLQEAMATICLDEDAALIAAQSDESHRVVVTSENLAYLIYTSGSTGRPKGVMVPHGGLTNLLLDMARELQVSESDVMTSIASYAFDMSLPELFLPLVTGATVDMVSSHLSQDGEELRRLVEAGITIFHATPTTWRLLLDSGWKGGALRAVAGAEAVPAQLAADLVGKVEGLWNYYGPTECTVWATAHPVSDITLDRPLPLGRPVANSRAYVLDEALGLVPPGTPGEIYLGGAGVTRGYAGRPGMTAERFLPDPFGEGQRLYKTGDIGRWGPDGRLEYLGRSDHQVKVRGHRIELGEVEAQLEQHPAVARAVVRVWGEHDERRIVGYVVPRIPGEVPADLAAHMRSRVPDYMVPAQFLRINEVPLTPNGKIDREALRMPSASDEPTAYVAPRTQLERVIANSIAAVLDRDRVGVHDNFFALGGHSLTAIRAAMRIRRETGVSVPLADFFQYPTVSDLADRLSPDPGTAPALVRTIRPEGRPAPLSNAQRRLWWLEMLQPGAIYNVSSVVRLRGALDPAALARAVDLVVTRHEVLRSRIETRDDVQVQIPVHIGTIATRADLSNLALDEAERQATVIARQLADEPFDLEAGPPMRAHVITLADDSHVLVVVIHHVMVDGWSMPLLWREISEAYAAFVEGRPADLPVLAMQYSDFAYRQQQTPPSLAAHLAYWTGRLADATGFELVTDHPRPAQWSGRGSRIAFDLPTNLGERLRRLARAHDVTLYMLFLAGFKTLLARYARNPDVVIGTPVAGRNAPELEPMIGCFVNTLVLRGNVSDDATFLELLKDVRSEVLDAYTYQDLPFEQLVEELNPPRDPSRNPLFQILFQFEERDTAALNVTGVRSEAVVIRPEAAKFDISLAMVDSGGSLGGSLEFATDLFEPTTIQALIDAYLLLLDSAATDPNTPLAQLQLLDPAHTNGTLAGNGTSVIEQPAERSVAELVARNAAAHPDQIAICQGERTLTYEELERRSNQLARYLGRRGIGAEDVVAILMERSPETVIAMLAVMKAGGTYLALDPSLPLRRRKQLLQDALPAALLSQEHLASVARAQHDIPVFSVDTDWAAVSSVEDTPLPDGPRLDNAAAIYYTSGSSGAPKGVMTPYRGIANYLRYVTDTLGVGERDVVLQLAGISFDASVRDIFGTLVAGAQLIFLSDETAKEPSSILEAIDQHRVTALLTLVPSMVSALARAKGTRDTGGETLRLALVTGEPLLDRHVRDARRLNPTMMVYNQYGPTECTVTSTYHRATDEPGPIPIGVPIPAADCRLLDDYGLPVPNGAIGELCITTPGLARGYLGRPGLTAERFVPDPFGAPGSRMYRTGDLARRRPGGGLTFHGRNDDQMKVRGVRIEPAEVEAALMAAPGVRTAAVRAFGQAPDVELIGFLVPEQQTVDLDAVHERLSLVLPLALIPNRYVVLESLPLTRNGKVDRRRLHATERQETNGTLRRARDPLELAMVRIWERILGTSPIGVTDNFFTIGGHSLKVVELVEAIRMDLGTAVPLTSVFTHPTVESLCETIAEGSHLSDSIVHLLADGDASRHPLFLVHPGSGDVCCYSELAQHLGGTRRIYGIESVGYSNDRPVLEDIKEMARVYIEEMKRVAPQGPYLLAGWSFGGNVAFEMAGQLEATGDVVQWLGIIDARAFGLDSIDDWYQQQNGLERFGVSEELPKEQVGELTEMDEEEALAFLLRNAKDHGRIPRRARTETMRRMVRVFAANGRAADRYRLEYWVSCPIHLFKATGRHPTLTYPSVVPATWQARTTGSFTSSLLDGNHHNFVFAPYVAALGAGMSESIARADPAPAGQMSTTLDHPIS